MRRLIRLHDYRAFDVFNFSAQEAKSLKWMDDGKEFLYKNEMYDVIEIVVKKDSCKITAIADKKEKHLFDQLAQSEHHTPASKKSLRFIFNLFSGSMPAFCSFAIGQDACENYFPLFSQSGYLDPVAEICTPPPEFSSFFRSLTRPFCKLNLVS